MCMFNASTIPDNCISPTPSLKRTAILLGSVNRMKLFHNRAVSITLPSGINKLGKMLFKISTGYISLTGPDGAVVMSSANGLVCTGFASRYGSNPERVFKDPIGRCMATTPSSFSLTSNRVTTNY